MSATRCPSCQRESLPNAEFCHHCGTRLNQAPATSPVDDPAPEPIVELPLPEVDESGRIRCPKCRTRNRPSSAHCRTCASPLRPQNIGRPGELIATNGQLIGRLAGFWVRAAAYLIDSVVLLALLVPFTIILFAFDTDDPQNGSLSRAQFVNFAVTLLYMVIGWSTFGTTVGKRIFNLYVVRPDGGSVSAVRALLRQLTTFLSVIFLCFGYMMVAVRPDKRSAHDILADTYVIIRDKYQ